MKKTANIQSLISGGMFEGTEFENALNENELTQRIFIEKNCPACQETAGKNYPNNCQCEKGNGRCGCCQNDRADEYCSCKKNSRGENKSVDEEGDENEQQISNTQTLISGGEFKKAKF